MRHQTQPPRVRQRIPAPIAIAAMAGTVLAFAAIALTAVLSEPSPIELAPPDFAATSNGDRFDHTHGRDLAAPDGMFPHLERTTGSAA